MSDLDFLATEQLTAKRNDTATADRTGGGDHALLNLQPKLGNQTIARLLQREMGGDEIEAKHDPTLQREGEEDELSAKHDPTLQREGEEDELSAKHDPTLQREGEEDELSAKHDVQRALDPGTAQNRSLEDEPGDDVVQGKHDLLQRSDPNENDQLRLPPNPDANASEDEIQNKHDPALQREGTPEDDVVDDERSGQVAMAKHDAAMQREDEGDVMAKGEVGLAGGQVSNAFSNTLESTRGGGTPLDDGFRNTMEDTLGHDLSDVRVHTGSEVDNMNQAITAQAFTTGSDVYVRSDKFSPGSSDTQRLLAHEVTHVAQQGQGKVESGGDGMTVGAADTSHEHEADEVADQVMNRMISRHEDHEATPA